MATNHNYIYLGFLDNDNDIIKVGMTQQTCYTRCKNADYTIYMAIEIMEKCNRFNLRAIETKVLKYYTNKYSIAKGNEYFNCSKSLTKITSEFMNITKAIIKQELGQVFYQEIKAKVRPNFY